MYLQIRGLGQNLRRYTAECVLPVNLFNDKIFLMYWWWFLILACLSFLGELSNTSCFLAKSLRSNIAPIAKLPWWMVDDLGRIINK